jgi:hypothetical protein
MATRKKKTVKAKAKSKSAKKKVVAKKAAPKKKAAPRKAAPKKKTAPAPKPGEGDIVSTQQLAIAEIVGDIEERMALDRLTATVE